MEIEPFIEIDRSKWPELRDLYRSNWPDGAVAFCLLDTLISYPDLAETFIHKVFAPEGVMTNGSVIVYDQDDHYELWIHPLEKIDKIEVALAKTKIIDWNRNITVASASPDVQDCLQRLSNVLGIKLSSDYLGRAMKHLLERNSKQFDICSCPPDTHVGEPSTEHLQIIDKTWTYYSERSYKVFEALARNHLCYVLFSAEDHSPLAWISIIYEGALTHLYCVEKHRRKGYAEFILKFAINEELKKGKDVLGYTLLHNEKAQKLFDKLNFKKIGCDTWINVTKT